MKIQLSSFAISAVLLTPVVVVAQAMTMLSPLPARYDFGKFEYVPPGGDGWREVISGPDSFRIVYAEQVDADRIETRVEFWAHAFAIDDPETAPDAFRLTLASYETRTEERGESIVAKSNIELLAGTAGIHTYTLVTKVGDKEVFEIFYVLLAPDKTGYVAGKFLTQDADYDDQPYYRPFLLSLASLKATAAAAGEAAEPAPAQPDRPDAAAPADAEPSAGTSDGAEGDAAD